MKNSHFWAFISMGLAFHLGIFALVYEGKNEVKAPPPLEKKLSLQDLAPSEQKYQKPERLREPANFVLNPKEKVFIYGRCYSRFGEIIPLRDKRYGDCINETNEFDHQGGRTAKQVGILFLIPN